MADESGGGGMRLTGAGKALLFLVGLAVLGYAGWTYRDQICRIGCATDAPAADAPRHDSARPRPPRRRPQKGVLARDPADRRAARRHGARRAAAALHQRSQAGRRLRLPARRPHRRRPRRQARRGGRSGLRGPARQAARRRDRPDHGRLRARSVDQGRGLVERLSRLRPLHDRARGHGRHLPLARRSRRQAHRDLRRPGRRALGARRTFPTRASASSRATTAGSKRWRRIRPTR